MDLGESLKELGSEVFEVEIKGHVLKSHLLNIAEELRVANITKDWDKTAGKNTAIKTATFALGVDYIDDEPFYLDTTDMPNIEAQRRFEKATHYMRSIVDIWFEQYTLKLGDMIDDLMELKKN